MNIILEDNLNFYDEINNFDSDQEEDDNNICLLSNLPLDSNHIVLPCNHSFNFFPLYKEIVSQKTGPYIGLEIDKPYFNQIKCPYCRQMSNYLLPHICINDQMTFITGVNSPNNLCMKFKNCNYIFKSGKKKGNKCDKVAFDTCNGCYCKLHQKSVNNKNNKNKHLLCKSILKSGKRKGQECGLRVKDSCNYCKRHLKNT
jgi:hypothetical protein